MPLSRSMNREKVREDFDAIARLADRHGGGTDRYESFLLSLIPREAASVLDVGCGLGRLTAKLAAANREVLGVDLSPEMISRARRNAGATEKIAFLCCDFLEHDFASRQFDCVITSAALHHVPADIAVPRMAGLLRAGGRLIIHDMRADAGMLDQVCSHAAMAQVAFARLLHTGRARSPRALREAWARHGAGETYLTLSEAQALANHLLPCSRVFNHWLWRYTIVWDKPDAT
jgi:2-polyprenyl-3-methyl-5-hydroxy-6-metoxy-1,4-benzoquinol methylase